MTHGMMVVNTCAGEGTNSAAQAVRDAVATSPASLKSAPVDTVLHAATRAVREQIDLAHAAVAIERWLRNDPGGHTDAHRLLEFVAQVRLSSARTGGDLSEIVLFQQALAQTSGALGQTLAKSPPDPE